MTCVQANAGLVLVRNTPHLTSFPYRNGCVLAASLIISADFLLECLGWRAGANRN